MRLNGQPWAIFLAVLLFTTLGACQLAERSDEAKNDHSSYAQAPTTPNQNIPTPGKKRIALTFDDAPKGRGPKYSGPERTRVLLETLAAVNAGPVTFFVTTQGLVKNEGASRIRQYAKAGHLIANHTHTHPWAKRTDVEDYLADIDLATQALDALSLPDGVLRHWFRFPFLDEGVPVEKRDALRMGLKERGLTNGYVTIDNYDWFLDSRWGKALKEGRSVDEKKLGQAYVDMLIGAIRFYDDLSVEHLGRSPAHLLLLHENDMAADYIDDLIIALRANDWEIISADEAYQDPIAQIVPTTLITGQGHVGALLVEAGVNPRTLTHLAIEEDQIVEWLEARGVFGPKP